MFKYITILMIIYLIFSISIGEVNCSYKNIEQQIFVSKVWELENAVTNSKSGTLILIEDGIYQLTKPLILRSDDVAIQGKNRDSDNR